MSFGNIRTVTAVMLAFSGIATGAEPANSHVELGHEDARVVHEGETEYNTESFSLAASWDVVNHLALLFEGKRTELAGGDFTTLKLGADAHWSVFRNSSSMRESPTTSAPAILRREDLVCAPGHQAGWR